MYIYLVFTKTGTVLSRVIKVFTKSKYVHVSLSFNKELSDMYSFGRKNPKNAFNGGFVKENIHKGLFKNVPESECLVYKIDITKKSKQWLLDEIQFFTDEKGKWRYNFIGLLAAKWNFPLKRKRHYFCSQFVSYLLINAEIIEINKPPELIRPTDILDKMDKDNKIYEGLIINYK